MGKLLRYEFRKTMLGKIILMAIIGTLELFFVIGLLADSTAIILISAFMLLMAASNGITFIGLWSLICLHRDMNTKQGYMLFMTPNSSFRILGAKVIETSLSILAAGACFTALGFLDVSLVLSHYGSVEQAWDLLREFGSNFLPILGINAGTFILLILSIICLYLCMVNIAFLADALSSAILRGKKVGFLVTLGFYLVMFVGVILLTNLVPTNYNASEYLLRIAIYLAISAGAYIGAAKLMDARLSV